jgi:hypothetical protein
MRHPHLHADRHSRSVTSIVHSLESCVSLYIIVHISTGAKRDRQEMFVYDLYTVDPVCISC